MKWFHRIHMHRSTRIALDVLLVVIGIAVCLMVWEYYKPHPDLVRWRALTGPTVKIGRFRYSVHVLEGFEIRHKQSRGCGCGVIIARLNNAYFVLTNNHIVGSQLFSYEIVHPAMPLPAEVKVLRTDPSRDLALVLFFSDIELPVAPIVKTAPYPSAKIWICGLGAGGAEMRIDDGILGKKSWAGRPPGYKADMWCGTASTWFGDSGGGVWTNKYELFGMVCAKRISRGMPAEGQFSIIPLPVIEEFLRPMGFLKRASKNPGETYFCLGLNNGEGKD